MVSTLDGSAIGVDGRSGSISSTVDRGLFLSLRGTGDVILVGAGTLRTENYSRVPTPIAVVSRRLDFSADLRLFAEPAREPLPIIFTTSQVAASSAMWLTNAADVVPCGDDSVDLAQVIHELASRGLTRIHCEGGPTLLGSLVAHDLVDELVLTLTPSLLGTPDRILHAGMAPQALRITGAWEQDGTVVIQSRRIPDSPQANR
jgi:riboflavin biosynthesis pyrimidine reductase